MIKVYIASPYTKGDAAVNVKRQIDTANKLMNIGYVPFTPLLYHFQHMIHPRPSEDWMIIDLEWLECCTCLLRLDGESPGADREVAYAKQKGIPVFHSIDDIIKFEYETDQDKLK